MMETRIDIDTQEILRRVGLGRSHELNQFMANEVMRFCAPYVPRSSASGAHMGNQARTTQKAVIYTGPYAHYQYEGKEMVSPSTGSTYAKKGERKQYNGREIQYNDGAKRGKHWDKRMLADRGDELLQSVETYIKERL